MQVSGVAGRQKSLAVVFHRAGLAVHQRLRANNFSAKSFPDGLMAQANAKNRRLARHVPDQRHQYPASCGVHGPGDNNIRSGFMASTSSGVTSSLRRTTTSAPSSPRYWTRLYVNES